MRLLTILTIVSICFLMASCRLKRFKSDEIKTIVIQASEVYCGGAAPPDDLLTEMARLKPLANRTILIYKNKDLKDGYTAYQTNEKGELNINGKSSETVFMSIYPSPDEFKVEPKEYDCYLRFVKNNLISVKLSSNTSKIEVTTVVDCNPCTPPIP